MPSNDMSTGISERIAYGTIIAATAKLVEKGYMTSDMQVYVAGGGVAALGSAWAWWINRPAAIMNSAAAQMPPNAKLVITTDPVASRQEKDAVHELASSAGEKVIAKITV